MKRTSLFPLVLSFIFFSPFLKAVEKSNVPAPPNILFILTDQWRFNAFGYAGNAVVRTPHIDQLEGESVNFTHAVSGVPVCCPTRASLITGQRPLTHGVFMNDVPLNPKANSIGKILKRVGYDTGYIGKWHIDGHGRSAFIPRERRQGFDYWKVLECTHNYTNSFYYADGPKILKWDGYDAIAQTRDAVAFLSARNTKSKPFALFLSFGPPHAPYHSAPQRYRDIYTARRIPAPPNVPHFFRELARKDLAGYYAHCTALDDCVRDLRESLQKADLQENTIIVFTTDHGDLIGSHGAYKKQQPYEESIRVPMLWHYPKRFGQGGKRLKALMNTEDIMPTLLGLCGIKIPTTVEGLDFSDHMSGGKNPNDGAALISCPAPFGQWARRWGGREFRGVRTESHTYVRDLRGPWLLYDNEKDPFQLNNLLDNPGNEDMQTRLEAILVRKLKQTGDEFLPGREYLTKWKYEIDATGTVPYQN